MERMVMNSRPEVAEKGRRKLSTTILTIKRSLHGLQENNYPSLCPAVCKVPIAKLKLARESSRMRSSRERDHRLRRGEEETPPRLIICFTDTFFSTSELQLFLCSLRAPLLTDMFFGFCSTICPWAPTPSATDYFVD